MKEVTEIESLKLTNTIQQRVIRERGDQLVEAIICLHKILPIARRYNVTVDNPNWLQEFEEKKEAIERAEKFLHDER